MIRNLLATTAVATLISTGAIAQTTTPTQPATQDPAAATMQQDAPMQIKAEGNLASNIIGEEVYNGTGDDAENIGEVNDLVIGKDGSIQAVVIGVGGFLGIGQKDVAIEYNLVEWVDRDDDRWMVVETTADALKAQQEFDRLAYQPMPADANVAETKPATAEDLANAPVEADQAEGDTVATAPADGATTTETETMAEAPAAETEQTDTMAAAPAEETAPAAAEGESDVDVVVVEPAEGEDANEETAQAPAEEVAPMNDNADQMETAAIDRSTLQPVDATGMSAEDFIGTTVYGANDDNVGEIGDIVLGQDGQIDAFIIDVGGFLGIGEKEVAVGMDQLEFLTDEDGNRYLYTNFTEEQLEAQPAYDEGSYAERRDEMRLVVPRS
ncbi:PRC-barrel domain-containing protein [Aquibium oceanicum]|uniref:Photosystem reaction center subunit H n=1 Tax=Aquibium oceanicum TaxID=1670800 RepID=A0A1L3SX82_9HYPH|nr:PRC-barrel domain-containing protein [Aquibium oceanicum]APH74036.1 photosystem reaction center subunit H [Aquibium oceanicum]